MAGVPRRKPARTALPDEAAWLAERERLEQADADETAAAGDSDEQPAGGPTPKGPSAGPSLPSMPRPTLKLPSRPSGGDLGGFLLGLGAYCLFLNYLRYGPVGVKGWLLAKFINSPLDLPAPSFDGSSSIDTGPQAPLSQEA